MADRTEHDKTQSGQSKAHHDSQTITTIRPVDVVDFQPDSTLYPFASNWFSSSAGSVHYLDEGAGQPMLLLHGNPNWSFIYRNLIPNLTDQFRCIAPDFPGFGLSGQPKSGYTFSPAEHSQALRELVDHLDLDNMIVVGMDWGGPIGLDIASRAPHRIGGLVMGGTWFWPITGGELQKFSKLLSSWPMQMLIKRRNFFVKTLMRKALEVDLSEREFGHYIEVAPTVQARTGQAVIVRHILQSAGWLAELEQRVSTQLADKPIVALFGELDTKIFGSPEARQRWADVFNDVTLIELAGANHFLQEEAPAAIVDAIKTKFV